MDKLTAISLIMIAAFSAQAAVSYFQSRPGATKLDKSLQVGESLKDENADLKARIAALEAIVTEPSYELKGQIRRL